MKLRRMKPHSLSYILSISLGVMMLMIVVVAFLRFAKGNVWVAISMAFISNLILSLFLGWVDIQETQEDQDKQSSGSKRMRRQQT